MLRLAVASLSSYAPASEADVSALSFRREPSPEADVERFGIDPNLAPAGEPHYLYDGPNGEGPALAKIGKAALARLRELFRGPKGVDHGGNGQTIGNAIITFAVTGTAQAGALAWDQAWFFSQIGDAAEGATFAIATMTPASTAFSNAQVADFLTFQPFCVVNMNLVSASAAAVVSGLQMRPVRLTPFGTSAASTVYNLQYQTTADFQTTRGQIPFAEIVDGYTYMRVNTPIQAVAATYNLSWLLGLRPDRRSQVPMLAPQVLNSSGRVG